MGELRFTMVERVSGKLRHNVSQIAADQLESVLDTHDPAQVDALQRLRQENELHGHSKEYKRIKSEELRAWTPAGILESGKGTSKITSYSGVVQIDIDEQDNDGMDGSDVKSLLPSLIPSCMYIGKSCGGGGVFALIRTSAQDETTYRATARAIIAALAVSGIKADPTTDEPTRLRFVTKDENPYKNAEAPVLSLPDKVLAYFTDGISVKTANRRRATTTPAPVTNAKHERPDGTTTTTTSPAPSLPLPRVKVNLPTGAKRRFTAALRAIAAQRLDIAPSDQEYITLIVSLKSAVIRHVFDEYDGIRLLLFISQFWTNPKNETWETTEANARRKFRTITGSIFAPDGSVGKPVSALNGFYSLCHRSGLKDA